MSEMTSGLVGRIVPNEVCKHEWEESISSQFSNEYSTEVYCAKCCTYGEKDNKTGDVFWPCT